MSKDEFKIIHYRSYGKESRWKGFEAVNLKLPGCNDEESNNGNLTMLLLDTSGSMRDNNKLNQAFDVIKPFSFDNYYTFTTDLKSHMSVDTFFQTKPEGGTKIQKNLIEMFSESLSIKNKKNKHLLIITDAEDTVDLSILEEKYKYTILKAREHNWFFSGSCLLIGDGQCKNNLKDLFRGAFYHTSSSEALSNLLSKILNEDKEISGMFEKIVNLVKDGKKRVIPHPDIQELDNDENFIEKTNKEVSELIGDLQNKINKLKKDINDVKESKHYQHGKDKIHTLKEICTRISDAKNDLETALEKIIKIYGAIDDVDLKKLKYYEQQIKKTENF